MSVHTVAPLRLMRSQCRSIRSFSTHFPRSAKATKAKPSASPAPRAGVSPLPGGRFSAPNINATPRPRNTGITDPQQRRAAQLYNAGVREIFREGSKSRIVASWIVGGGCILSAGLVVSLQLWNTDNLVGMGKWEKQFVAGANRVVPVFLSLMGGGIILRYAGAIRSIKLVAISRSRVNLQVHMRRRLPWSETNYLVDPGDLLMPKNWQHELLPEVESPSRLADTLGTPYQWMRSWINNDRIITPVWLNKDSLGYMDGDGKFGVSVEDFAAITSEGRRRS